jgi:hypothetical protein
MLKQFVKIGKGNFIRITNKKEANKALIDEIKQNSMISAGE